MIQAPVEEPPPSSPPAVEGEGEDEDGLWSRLDPAGSPDPAPAPPTPPGLEGASEADHVHAAGTARRRSRAPRAGAMALVGAAATVLVGLVLFAGLLSPGGSPRARSAAVHHSEATGTAAAIHKTGETVKPSTKSRAVTKRAALHPRRRASSHARTKNSVSARRASPARSTSVAHRAPEAAAPSTSGNPSTSKDTPDSSPSPARNSTPPAQQTLTHTQSGPTGLGYEVGTGCDPTCR